jgi:60 kDa SS-A/Ro ribonucleoprotein
MAIFNFKSKNKNNTVNLAGGQAYTQSPEMTLASLVLTSFAQDQFYRTHGETFEALKAAMIQCDPAFVAKTGVYARTQFGMRSITHVLAAELAQAASGKTWSKAFYDKIVNRPDDMLEIAAYFMAQNKGKNLPNAMKKGFAEAFNRFDTYQLAKYRGENHAVKLVDLVNLVRPVPTAKNTDGLKNLVADTLRSTETWEAKLTQAGQVAGNEDEKSELKSAAWAELIGGGKLGYFALLRNLRNIAEQAPELTSKVCAMLTNRHAIERSLVLPFRFLTAMDAIQSANIARKNDFVRALNTALEVSLDNVPRFSGKTLVVLDDSGSMSVATKYGLSAIRLGSAFAAALFKSNDADLMRFSDNASYVRANVGDTMMTIADNLVRNAQASGTNFHTIFNAANRKYDRVIILSDMQGWMGGNAPTAEFANYKNRFKANPFVYSFDLAGYGTLQLPENQVFAMAGFSDKVFDTMALLETDRNALVSAIEAVELT